MAKNEVKTKSEVINFVPDKSSIKKKRKNKKFVVVVIGLRSRSGMIFDGYPFLPNK